MITFHIEKLAYHVRLYASRNVIFNRSTDFHETWYAHNATLDYITYILVTYGAEPFLRSCQLCSHSGNSQQF
jgi:hypothetical protein